jgi:hypothetical protein
MSCGTHKDSSDNGVRGDVNQYIAETYSDSQKRDALLQHAKALQKVFSATTAEEATTVNLEIIDSLKKIKSLGEISGIDAPSRIVFRKTFNTPDRLRIMPTYENLLGNHAFKIFSPDDIALSLNNTARFKLVSSSILLTSSTADYLVPYINGMNTSDIDAIYEAMDFAIAIGNHNGNAVAVILAYNPTRKFMSDLADVFQQKLNEYPNVKSDLILKALLYNGFDSALPQPLQDSIAQYHVNKIKDYGYVSYNDSDLESILVDIRSNMTTGQKILLVGYSQGCIYANEIFSKLTTGSDAIAKTAVGIVAIASPAAYVAKGGYLTSTNDQIIELLRLAGFSVLPSNITIGLTTKDLSGHGLIDVYLNPDLEGYAEIINLIHAVMDSLYYPSGGVHPGGWTEV